MTLGSSAQLRHYGRRSSDRIVETNRKNGCFKKFEDAREAVESVQRLGRLIAGNAWRAQHVAR
jgi:hypothetical protein